MAADFFKVATDGKSPDFFLKKEKEASSFLPHTVAYLVP